MLTETRRRPPQRPGARPHRKRRARHLGTAAADLDIHTSDGHIDCQLPLKMNGYNSGGGHTISGKLNAGGTPLTIHTRDGNLTVGTL